MTIKQYRKKLKLSQEEFAVALGLSSKGFISEIERTNSCSARIALLIESHSCGLVNAAKLNSDVAAARRVAA